MGSAPYETVSNKTFNQETNGQETDIEEGELVKKVGRVVVIGKLVVGRASRVGRDAATARTGSIAGGLLPL